MVYAWHVLGLLFGSLHCVGVLCGACTYTLQLLAMQFLLTLWEWSGGGCTNKKRAYGWHLCVIELVLHSTLRLLTADITSKDLSSNERLYDLFDNMPCLPGKRSPCRLISWWAILVSSPVQLIHKNRHPYELLPCKVRPEMDI